MNRRGRRRGRGPVTSKNAVARFREREFACAEGGQGTSLSSRQKKRVGDWVAGVLDDGDRESIECNLRSEAKEVVEKCSSRAALTARGIGGSVVARAPDIECGLSLPALHQNLERLQS
jgi:hypothetical protein